MTRTALVAAAALLLATPATAQSQQERLDARYDRALAAGYKALMLCSAIANAEANGASRTPESVERWELSGIQAPLDGIVPSLGHRVLRSTDGSDSLVRVEVDWSDDLPPRMAMLVAREGCRLAPVGMAPSNEEDVSVQGASDTPGSDVAKSEPLAIQSRAELPSEMIMVSFGAFEGRYGQGARTTAVLVSTADNELEQYLPEFEENVPQRTWSVAKSLAATLVGAAVHRGEVDVNVSAGLGEDETDPRRAITIDHLLRMASGRYSDTPGNRTDPLYYGGAAVDEVALGWPLIAAPASTYRYANNDTLAAIAAIKPTFEAYPPASLFDALGMNETVAETDWQGDYILSSQVWTTASDLAAFGQLYLNDGKLRDGTRILPEGWVQYVSTPSGPQPDGPFGYGAGFWLMNKSDGVPPDTFAAFGNRGQYVVIVPARQVVIVRRGEDRVGASFDIAAFTRDVLAALESE
jgi:CubicO group peptidase (beta-lactamase class C family)